MNKFYKWLLWTKWVEIPLGILALPAWPANWLCRRRLEYITGEPYGPASTDTQRSTLAQRIGRQAQEVRKNLH